MDEADQIYRYGAVAVVDGHIASIGPAQHVEESFHSSRVYSGKNRIVMPGLINGHTHAAMSLFRGYADDKPLMEWLNDYINPVEAFAIDDHFVRVGTKLAALEMLLSGTTTFADMYFCHETAAQVADEVGIRALISASVVDQPRNDAINIDDSFEQARAFIPKWTNTDSTVQPILSGHAIYTLQNDHLLRLRDLAMEFDVPIHIHVSETEFELGFSTEKYGTTPILHFRDIGFLDVPVIAAHVVWPTVHEIEVMAQYGVGVVHNPTCNAKIASGTAPIVDMLAAGINVGLGTDGSASNNGLDIWEEMRVASLLQRTITKDSTALPARNMLQMATCMGAGAFRLGDKIGSLKVGMQADLIQVDVGDVRHVPMYDVESQLAYNTRSPDVVSVFVKGRELVRERVCQTIDIRRLRAEVEQIVQQVADFRKGRD